MAGHTLVEIARDTLVLTEVPARILPWMYMAVAGLTAVACFAGRSQACAPTRRLRIYLAGAVLFCTLMPLLGDALPRVRPYLFHLAAGLLGTLISTQVWTVAARGLSAPRTAYALVGAAGLAGAGGASTLCAVLPVRLELTFLALGGGLFFLVARTLVSEPAGQVPSPMGPIAPDALNRSGFRAAWTGGGPCLVWLLALGIAASACATLVDFTFKISLAGAVSGDKLPRFLSCYHGATNAVGLGVQLIGVPWLLGRVREHRLLAVLPGALCAGSVLYVTCPAAVGAAVMKGLDACLRHTLNRTAVEFIYLPLPDAARLVCKPVIDGVGQRTGQALGAVASLGAHATGLSPAALGVVLGCSGLVWLQITLKLRAAGSPGAPRFLGINSGSPRDQLG